MATDPYIREALHALQDGDPILLYDSDGREAEVDMVYAAAHVTPENISRLRNDAGGLVCAAVDGQVAAELGIPYHRDAIDHPTAEGGERAYGDRSSFALWVNHADTYTGVTDEDRATTIDALVDTAEAGDADRFNEEFTTPGHVALLRAAQGLLQDRQGHTEMSVYLVKKANMVPVAVVCEMLDDDTGGALSKEDAQAYADEHGFVLLDGETVQKDFQALAEKVQP